jgi:Ferritin-like domain
VAVLNFALNLEYLEAEYYLRGVTGDGRDDNQISGAGKRGSRKVKFETKLGRQYADDERAHVDFLRRAVGKSEVPPRDQLTDAFNAAATAGRADQEGERSILERIIDPIPWPGTVRSSFAPVSRSPTNRPCGRQYGRDVRPSPRARGLRSDGVRQGVR